MCGKMDKKREWKKAVLGKRSASTDWIENPGQHFYCPVWPSGQLLG